MYTESPQSEVSLSRNFKAFLSKCEDEDAHTFYVLGAPISVKKEIKMRHMFFCTKEISIVNQDISKEIFLAHFPKTQPVTGYENQHGMHRLTTQNTIGSLNEENFEVPATYKIQTTKRREEYISTSSQNKDESPIYTIPSEDITILEASIFVISNIGNVQVGTPISCNFSEDKNEVTSRLNR